MTVLTILYYTRYVGKLSKCSLSYLCPDLPIVVRIHYNRRSLWSSSSCERDSFKCNKAQVCKYACTLVCTYTHTYIRRSNFTLSVGAIINVFNQIHYRWCHKTDAASMWHNINGTYMSCATLFLAIIVLLFFIFHPTFPTNGTFFFSVCLRWRSEQEFEMHWLFIPAAEDLHQSAMNVSFCGLG